MKWTTLNLIVKSAVDFVFILFMQLNDVENVNVCHFSVCGKLEGYVNILTKLCTLFLGKFVINM